MRKLRANSPLRSWDTYWQKKWEEEKKIDREKVLTTDRKYDIIKSR